MPPPRHRRTSEQAAEALARVGPLVSRWVERLLAANDPPLTPAQYLALRAVADGDLVGADLARRAAVSPAAVSQLLTGLESAGLVQRSHAPDDRRRHTLALSDEGRRVLGDAERVLRESLAELLEALPPPEADALARALGQVEALLTGTAPPPRPQRPRPPHPRPRPR